MNTIKTLRNKLNLKQTEFAALLGATEQSVVNWENDKNKNKLKKSTLNLIAKTFNVSPAWLLTGEGEMFSSAAAPIDAERFIKIYELAEKNFNELKPLKIARIACNLYNAAYTADEAAHMAEAERRLNDLLN